MADDAPALNGNASHLAWLRTRHEALTADRHLDLDIPGYEGRLVVRFGPVPWKAIAKTQALANRDDRDGRTLAHANMDVLIAACREILFRDDGGELIPVDPSGESRRFDAELGALFGQDFKTAREALRWVYGNNEVAMAVSAGEVLDWTQRMDTETAEELAGE
jgi:hypothetical protein